MERESSATGSMYLAPKSSPSMTKRNQKNSDEYIRGPWFEKDYGTQYDADQMTWKKLKDLQWREVFSGMKAFVCAKGERLSEVYFQGYPVVDFFIPCLRWLKIYNWRSWLWNDLIAGIAIACMVVPQGMSYAAGIAMLPQVYGLYTAFTPCLIYGVFGTSRQLAVGPVAVVATLLASSLQSVMPPIWNDPTFGYTEKKGKNAYLKPFPPTLSHPKYDPVRCAPLMADLGAVTAAMLNDPAYAGCRFAVYSAVQDLYNKYAIQTSLLVGMLQVILGTVRLGFLTNFLSHSVISGFTTGAAFIIGLGQVGDLWGYKLLKKDYVYESLDYIFHGLPDVQWRDFVMSAVWLTILLGFKAIGKRFKKLHWLRIIGPLFICILSILVTVCGDSAHGNITWRQYRTIGKVPDGMPPVTFHLLSVSAVSKLWRAVLAVASVDLMESIALGKAMARKNGYKIDSNDEYRALGIMNVIGSGFSIMPATGSFSRTAVNNSVGAKSPLACFTTGVVVALVLLFITPVFQYMPKNALAAIIISGVLGLLEFSEAKYLWRVSKKDFVVWVICWLSTMMLGVDIGLAISVGVALLIVIYESAFPHSAVLGRIPGTTVYRNINQYPNAQQVDGLLLVRVDAPIYFANTTFIRDKLDEYIDLALGVKRRARCSEPGSKGPEEGSASDRETVSGAATDGGQIVPEESGSSGTKSPVTMVRMGRGKIQYLVLDFSPVTRIDATALHMLEEMVADAKARGIQLVLVNPNHFVIAMFDLSGFTSKLGRENIFVRMHDAVTACSSSGI